MDSEMERRQYINVRIIKRLLLRDELNLHFGIIAFQNLLRDAQVANGSVNVSEKHLIIATFKILPTVHMYVSHVSDLRGRPAGKGQNALKSNNAGEMKMMKNAESPTYSTVHSK